MPTTIRTTIAILGAGPAGIVLAHLLRQQGISCVITDAHTRAEIYARGRAGLLESTTVALLKKYRLDGPVLARGTRHDKCEFRFPDFSMLLEYGKLVGNETHWTYPQNDLVDDLMQMYLDDGGEIHFGYGGVSIRDDGDGICVACTHSTSGETLQLECEFVIGCDGYHGIARKSVPSDAVTIYNKQHAYGWLAVLAEAPPSTDHIIYALHPDGFAGHMLRSEKISRYYLQVKLDDHVDAWDDQRIWQTLERRLEKKDWALTRGRIVEKRMLAMRSYVMEPMRHGRLFLAGDAAHIITPCGGKGMNLAIQDVGALADVLHDYYADDKNPAHLDRYSTQRLPMIWRAQEFSYSMLVMLHKPEASDPAERAFLQKLNESKLAQLLTSETYKRDFSRNYVGII